MPGENCGACHALRYYGGGPFEEGNIFRNHVCPAKDEKAYEQCPDCGQWFEEGNIFRNHICPAKESQEVEYVRCDVCGDWFPAGNVFRNHQCVNYPSEDNPEL